MTDLIMVGLIIVYFGIAKNGMVLARSLRPNRQKNTLHRYYQKHDVELKFAPNEKLGFTVTERTDAVGTKVCLVKSVPIVQRVYLPEGVRFVGPRFEAPEQDVRAKDIVSVQIGDRELPHEEVMMLLASPVNTSETEIVVNFKRPKLFNPAKLVLQFGQEDETDGKCENGHRQELMEYQKGDKTSKHAFLSDFRVLSTDGMMHEREIARRDAEIKQTILDELKRLMADKVEEPLENIDVEQWVKEEFGVSLEDYMANYDAESESDSNSEANSPRQWSRRRISSEEKTESEPVGNIMPPLPLGRENEEHKTSDLQAEKELDNAYYEPASQAQVENDHQMEAALLRSLLETRADFATLNADFDFNAISVSKEEHAELERQRQDMVLPPICLTETPGYVVAHITVTNDIWEEDICLKIDDARLDHPKSFYTMFKRSAVKRFGQKYNFKCDQLEATLSVKTEEPDDGTLVTMTSDGSSFERSDNAEF